MSRFLTRLGVMLHATRLCLKYPFLYVRNANTGLHYNNWELLTTASNFYRKAYEWKDGRNRIKNIWYAFLYRVIRLWHDGPLQLFHCIPDMTMLDMMPTAWNDRFGMKFAEDLKRAIISDAEWRKLFSVHMLDLKEKNGELVVSLTFSGKNTDEVLERYADVSIHTCMRCGHDAIGVTTGWIVPLCMDCYRASKAGREPSWFHFYGEPDGDREGNVYIEVDDGECMIPVR